ncbi:MAG: hypothetical protein WBC05_14045 [Sedimentisphaerales bacterium]
MRAENKTKIKPQKKTGTRVLKLALAIIAILIVFVLLLVPAIVSSGKGREIILAKINGSIAGKTNFADLSMGWLKGIKVADFSFNDNAGQISVQVREIATKPHYGSLLTGNLSFGQTLIDTPNVEINLKDLQVQKAKSPAPKRPAGEGMQPFVLPVKRMELVLNDGNVKVTDPKSGTVELSRINSKLNLQPLGQQSNFDLTMAVAQAGKASQIQVAGTITPKQQTGWSLKGTSGSLTVDVKDLDLESLGPILALAGVDIQAEGVVGARATGQIKDGQIEDLDAGIKGKNLQITGAQLKGDRLQTGDLDISVKLKQNKEAINIDNLQLKSDWASVAASGVVPTTFKSLSDLLDADSNYNLKGTFNCNLAAVSSQMPKTLGLKEGMQLTSGQLNGNVETSTKAGGQKQIQANATITALEGSVEGKKIAMSQPIEAEAQISSDKAGINFDKVDVSASFAKINCAGSTKLVKYSAEADLAKLQAELGQFINIGQYQMSGEIQESGQISIEEDKIAASGSGTVKNLRLISQEGLSASEPMANIDFAVNMDRKKNLVAIDSVIANASLGRFSVKDGIVPLGDEPATPLSLEISANNVNFEKVRPFAVMFASFPKEMQLAGIAESTISVSSEKKTYKITTDSTKIKGLKLSSPGKKPFEPNEVTLAFEAEIDTEQKAINVKTLQLESPQIKITKGQFSQVSKDGKTTLQGQADCEYDWSAVSAVAAPFLPEDLTLQGKRKDAVSFISEYPTDQSDKLLSNLNAKANVGFEKAGYMGLDFGPTDVDIQVQNGLLNITPFTTTVNEGQFNFAGGADFKQTPSLFKAAKPMQIVKDIKVNDATTKKLLKYVNPIFADAVNVSGIANFNCEQLAIPLSAEAKNDTVVIGTISISELKLQASDLLGQILSASGGARGTVLTIHPTKLVLQKGVLRYDNMQIDVGDNPINFKGAIGLDKSLDMTVTLPYTTAGRTVRTGRETSGARITLPLKGTVDKPQLDTGKLIELQLKGQLEEQLRRGLEDIFK